MSKIRITMSGYSVVADLEPDAAKKIFQNFANTLLSKLENNDNLAKKKRQLDKKGDKQGYKGFLYVKCSHCGEVKGYCASDYITESKCSCGECTELKDMHPLYVDCQCGKSFRYMTNMTDKVFDVPCLECGNPVAVEWRDKYQQYQTIK